MLRLLLPTPSDGVSSAPLCLGAIVALYLCLVVVVVLAARTRETFRFGDGMPAVDTPSVTKPDIGTSSVAKPDIGTSSIAKPDISTSSVAKPDINTSSIPNSNVRVPSTPSKSDKTVAARPRMVRSLQATTAEGKDAQLELDDAAFAPSAVWMRKDAQYLMRDVFPVHNSLMQTKSLFGGESGNVGRQHRCPKVSSTDALMGNQSRAMYQCAETALLRVLPAMNQPVKMD